MAGKSLVIHKTPQDYYKANLTCNSQEGKKAIINSCIENARLFLEGGEAGGKACPSLELFPVYEAIKENFQIIVDVIGKENPELLQMHKNWLDESEKKWGHLRTSSPESTKPQAPDPRAETPAESQKPHLQSRPPVAQSPQVLGTRISDPDPNIDHFEDANEDFIPEKAEEESSLAPPPQSEVSPSLGMGNPAIDKLALLVSQQRKREL